MKFTIKKFNITDSEIIDTPKGFIVAQFYNYSYNDLTKQHMISALLVEDDEEDEEEFDLDGVIKEKVEEYIKDLLDKSKKG